MNVTILVVNGHAPVCTTISQALSSRPEIKLVVAAQDHAEAEKQADQLFPDIIWLEMNNGNSDSIVEIRRLKKRFPASHIIAIVNEEDEQEALAAITAGAQGYLSRQDIDPSEIMSVLQMLCRDEFVIRPALLVSLMQSLRAIALRGSVNASSSRALHFKKQLGGLAQLTVWERKILKLIGQGDSDHNTAKRLHISEKAVHRHVQGILRKLGL